MDDSKLPTPHNNFFHYALSHAHAARDLIQTHLPPNLVQLLDLHSLELQKDSFIDEDLRQSFSDLLYSVQFAGANDPSIEGQVYLLFEHKSQSDPMTCFQLLRYIVRMSYPVLDIARVPDESLAGDPFLQSVLGLLKYSRRRDFEEKLEFLLQCMLKSGTIEIRPEHVEAVIVYISSASPLIPIEKLTMTIEKLFHTQVEPGSIADRFIKQGRQEGLQEGLKEGEIHLIQTLQEILGLPLSDGATLEDRSLEQLQAITGELRQQFRDRK